MKRKKKGGGELPRQSILFRNALNVHGRHDASIEERRTLNHFPEVVASAISLLFSIPRKFLFFAEKGTIRAS